MLEPDDKLPQLDAFMSLFAGAFRRRDQARWASVYLQALLTADGRKTINHLARRVVLPPALTVEDVAQALQNFVNQSPWDEQTLWRRYRSLLAERFLEPDGVFVLNDLTFVKQGRHSVGVQRQYSSARRCKTNCQIAVALHYAGTALACPLGLRLYLPRAWQQQPHRLDAAGVPQEMRRAQGKAEVALDLIDEASRDGWNIRRVLGAAGLGADQDFRDGLHSRGLAFSLEAQAGLEITQMEAVLMDKLGLDHFEGRSWRGFHHHACLVMLAFGFRLLHPCRGHCSPAEAVASGA